MSRPRLLVVGLFLSYAWFYQGGGWNQNSRFDLVRAVVERGTVTIDPYRENTRDRARCGAGGAHFCSDKAPGLALYAVPAAAVARPFLVEPGGLPYARELSYLLTLWAAALPAVAAALCLWWTARQLGASEGGAAFAAATLGLATPLWAYATLFMGHALATGALAAALAAATALDREGSARRDLVVGAALGLAGGWAAITDYPAAPAAAIVFALALANVWRGGRGRRARVAASAAAGAGVAIAVLLAYNLAAFGRATDVGYRHVEGFEGLREGVMGVTWPRAGALWAITFGQFRGLFFHAPVLLAAAAAFPPLVRADGLARRTGIAAAAVVAYYLLFNAAYHYWDGGWAYGPRHVTPALPFLCLPLALLWTRGTRAARAVAGTLAVASTLVTLVAVSTTVQPPNDLRRPLADLQWPAFADGRLALSDQSFLDVDGAPDRPRGKAWSEGSWNLGLWIGLDGKASLAPLVLSWAALGVAYRASYGYKSSR